jgi:hypothetical protein
MSFDLITIKSRFRGELTGYSDSAANKHKQYPWFPAFPISNRNPSCFGCHNTYAILLALEAAVCGEIIGGLALPEKGSEIGGKLGMNLAAVVQLVIKVQ